MAHRARSCGRPGESALRTMHLCTNSNGRAKRPHMRRNRRSPDGRKRSSQGFEFISFVLVVANFLPRELEKAGIAAKMEIMEKKKD